MCFYFYNLSKGRYHSLVQVGHQLTVHLKVLVKLGMYIQITRFLEQQMNFRFEVLRTGTSCSYIFRVFYITIYKYFSQK